MRSCKNWIDQAIVALLLFGTAEAVNAASIQKCSNANIGGSVRILCSIQLEDGMVGDRVRILNEKAHVVAVGHITKRQNGPYGQIVIANMRESIRKNYPVIIDMEGRSSNLQWAASFAK